MLNYLSLSEIEERLQAADFTDRVEVSDDGDGWFALTVRAKDKPEAVNTKKALDRRFVGASNLRITANFVPYPATSPSP